MISLESQDVIEILIIDDIFVIHFVVVVVSLRGDRMRSKTPNKSY
jgi:hypothetical protein